MSKYNWLMKIDMHGTHYYIIMNPKTRAQKQSMIEEVKAELHTYDPVSDKWKVEERLLYKLINQGVTIKVYHSLTSAKKGFASIDTASK